MLGGAAPYAGFGSKLDEKAIGLPHGKADAA
jgi:hypothetical protein